MIEKKLLYFLGVYISFGGFVICSLMDIERGCLIFRLMTISLFCVFLLRENNKNKVDFEKIVLLLFVALLSTLMMIRGKLQGQNLAINVVSVFLILFVTFLYFVRNYHVICIKQFFSQNGMIVLVILLFSLLSIEIIDSWFMWDSRVYYAAPNSDNDVQGMVFNFNENLAGIEGLYLADHVSIGYSLWLILFQLFKEGSESVQIANIVLAEFSILAYYHILRKILGNKFSNNILALATIPYAFSPYVLGMVGNLNLDSAVMYFFVIFVACSLYKYEVLECVFAFCLCFTKENAVIYYIVYIVVKVVVEYLKDNPFRWQDLIRFGFGNIKNYIYALPVILWEVLRLLKSVWGGDQLWNNEGMNCFGISINVIEMKLKQVFLLNFNWIFWGILLVGGIILVRNKIVNKEILSKLIPISAFGVMVIVFGCLYVTWTHARYIVPLIPVLYLIVTSVVANLIKKNNVFCIWNIIMSSILLIQNFYVVDPIMSSSFDSILVGNGKLYSMQLNGNSRIKSNRRVNDSIVYNRQYIYWQEALIDTLRKARYDSDMLIVFPEGTDCTYYSLLGQWDNIVLWNTEKEKLEYYNENYEIPNNCTWLKVCYIPDVAQAYDGNDMLYIIPRWADIDMNFLSNKNVIRQGEVDNKGFNIRYMVMNIDNNLPLNDGRYVISPKQDNTLGLCTKGGDGGFALLDEDATPLSLVANNNITYHINFEEYKVALDVPRGRIDSNGTVQVWSINSTNGQKWVLEEVDGYYMICFKDYALTYNLEDNSVKLLPKTGEDSQLWLFSK